MPEPEIDSTSAESVKVDAITGKEKMTSNQPSEERAASSSGRGDASSQRQHLSGGRLPDQFLEHRDQACFLTYA